MFRMSFVWAGRGSPPLVRKSFSQSSSDTIYTPFSSAHHRHSRPSRPSVSMDVCQPISYMPSSAFAYSMKMQSPQDYQLQQQHRQQQQQRQQFQAQRQKQLQQLQQQQQQQHFQQTQDALSLSPDSLYGYSLDEYTNFASNSYGTDISADSPLSLGSPVSPTTANPLVLAGTRNGFDSWNMIDSSDADDYSFVKAETGDSPLLFANAFPTLDRDLSVSPAINPLELSNSGTSGDLNLPGPHQQQEEAQAGEKEPEQQESSMSPASSISDAATKSGTTRPRDRRYAVRKPSSASRSSTATASSTQKRKSSSISSSQSRSPRSLTSASPPQPKQLTSASQPPKKTAHNLIEKRYRTNLNDKILALRDSVPSLRVVARRVDSMGGSDEEDNDNMLTSFAPEGADGEDLSGLTPAHKLNKATILSKATEYIAHLERRNQDLIRENTSLQGKVDGYEMLIMSRGGQNGVWC
ncbi:hypothetical protein SEPCBS119000_005680 [Sporothrix epigloea]|uniref:BHLH domain-containing protein n=1 Tax=Sporothrix epigloea TaxID=1892477 RepID=A0ABP0DYV2_9PEZI